MTLFDRLENYRLNNRLSIRALCNKLRISQPAYSRWKRGGGMSPLLQRAVENMLNKEVDDVPSDNH